MKVANEVRLIDANALKERWTIASPEPYTTDAAEVLDSIEKAPTIDAVEVTAQEIQFLIEGLYGHIKWLKAAGMDRPECECGYDERKELLEKLTLFEAEHFPAKMEDEG